MTQDSSDTSSVCRSADYLQAGKLLLTEVKSRFEIGSIRAHLGVQGLLALLDDKIRRFNQDYDADELLGMAVDSFVIFAQAAKKLGLLDMSRVSKIPSEKSKPSERREVQLPEAHGGGSRQEILTPCPRCLKTDVPAGEKTIDLPDCVCVECEKDLPEEKLDVQTYISWIQQGVDQ